MNSSGGNRRHRRPLGSKCYVDEVFFFRGKAKHYHYRAVDETGQVVDVLFREHRDTESAVAFFRQALARTGWHPTQVISDHQPYVRAVQEVLPEVEHVRTGLHRARGETTKPIERSHVFTRVSMPTTTTLPGHTAPYGYCLRLVDQYGSQAVAL